MASFFLQSSKWLSRPETHRNVYTLSQHPESLQNRKDISSLFYTLIKHKTPLSFKKRGFIINPSYPHLKLNGSENLFSNFIYFKLSLFTLEIYYEKKGDTALHKEVLVEFTYKQTDL